MINKLGDGSVLPSNLKASSFGQANQTLNNNLSIKTGVVVKATYPDENGNISKNVVEYDVLVAQNDQGMNSNVSIYRNCKVADQFGGPSQHSQFTLEVQKQDKGSYSKGSLVLLACVDGRSTGGNNYIIGGVANHDAPTDYKKEDGRFFETSFNGVTVKIDKDGQYSLTFNSATDQDGKVANEKAQGTSLTIDKDGRMTLADNEKQVIKLDREAKKITITNETESIVIDKENKTISLSAEKDINVTSKENTTVTADKQFTVNSKADQAINSEQGVNVSAKGNVGVKSGGNWTADIQGNMQVKAGQNMVLEAGNVQILKQTTALIGSGTVPQAGIGISQAVGVNQGGPVISTIITGSQTVFIGA